jgi:anti-sigma factor RsiW
MNCKDTEQVIHAYLDGELDLVRSLAVEEHLKDCPLCAGAQRERQSLRSAMKSQSLYFEASKGLQNRIRRAVGQADQEEAKDPVRPKVWKWIWRRILTPVAATALVALIALPLALHYSSQNSLLDEIVSAHVRSLMSGTSHLTDVASSDQHTVKPWFTGKLPFSPTVSDFTAQGFPLLGGRMDYFQEHPVAALVYQRRKHLINLFIWPIDRERGARPDFAERHGYNIIHWTQSGMTFWAVSDVSMSDLRDFAQLVQLDAPVK